MNNKIINLIGASTGLLGVLSTFYQGQGQQFVRSYTHDFTLPFSGFFMLNLFNTEMSRAQKALYLFGGCSALEVAQGLGLYHGTYDPKDFIAYASGAGLAYFLDKFLVNRKQEARK